MRPRLYIAVILVPVVGCANVSETTEDSTSDTQTIPVVRSGTFASGSEGFRELTGPSLLPDSFKWNDRTYRTTDTSPVFWMSYVHRTSAVTSQSAYVYSAVNYKLKSTSTATTTTLTVPLFEHIMGARGESSSFSDRYRPWSWEVVTATPNTVQGHWKWRDSYIICDPNPCPRSYDRGYLNARIFKTTAVVEVTANVDTSLLFGTRSTTLEAISAVAHRQSTEFVEPPTFPCTSTEDVFELGVSCDHDTLLPR